MATIRSYANPFEVIDLTQELNLVPNTWGLLNELNIFRREGVTQHTISLESVAGTLGLITDQVRGARNLVNKDDVRSIYAFNIAHYPQDDGVSPEDVQGKRAYGSDGAETVDAVIARKLERLSRNHAVTLEFARAYAITQGAAWAPNGTISENYYTKFGITRKEIDFVLGTATTDVLAKSEEGLAHIQDNIMTGEVVDRAVVLASPEFFAKLISQANVKDAFKFYSSSQEPLRNRLGSGLYRRFIFGSIEYIEYRGSYNGQRMIPAGEAYMLPVGTTDMFITYNSPAMKFGDVNTLGEPSYAFTYYDPREEKILIQTEQNFLNVVRRPQAVVKLITSN